MYARDDKFAKRLANLRSAYPLLADYLVQVRRSWSSSLLARRNAQEHEGWTLPDVDYRVSPGPHVEFVEPQIDGVPVRQYAENMFNRVATFAENVIAYGYKCALKQPLTLLEVPLTARHPDFPKRFRLGIVEPGTTEWVLTYRETEF